MLQVGFLIPFDEHPERRLREQVAEIPDGRVRGDLLVRLDELDAARARVAATATAPAQLHAAMGELATAVRAAGGTATRTISRHDLGRTSVYLDCRRDLDVELGEPLLAALAGPLGLLLRAADWVAAEVGDVVERHMAKALHAMRREVVTLAELQAAVTDVLVPGNDIVAAVHEDFQLRWAEILPDAATGPVRLTTAGLRGLVDALFPERTPCWAAARHHTPDLMLARQPDGGHLWVLGELHVALNTLESRLFATQCADRPSLVDATARDFAAGRVVPLYPHDGVANNSRTYPPPALDPPGGFHYWSFGADHGHEHGVAAVPATAVRVVERDGVLVGVTDGWRAPVAEFFGEFLTSLCVNMFTLRARRAWAPRVLIDEVVVCRESWHVPATDVPLPRSRPQDHTYRCLREWAGRHGMPRHVFVHTRVRSSRCTWTSPPPRCWTTWPAWSGRPAREGLPVTVTEMLPGPDQLWLRDPAGRRYPAELRMVAVRATAADRVVTEA
ncbi:hypothetical protein [Kutzneria kofuensis]|uniref:hypothetical protein n=1 Tax=Kutzneria kofuensis TaxID=103725 RepID=UPI0031EFC9D4